MKKWNVFLVFVFLVNITSFSQGIKYTKNDTLKYIVKNELPRFFGGTFMTGIELPLQNKKSIVLSGLATYGSNSNVNQQVVGYGLDFQYRSYLGKGDFTTNFPIYMAGQLMYRHVSKYQIESVYTYTDGISAPTGSMQSEVRSDYNVFYGGILLGCQVFVNQVFTLDLNFGGGLRLSKYEGESNFTRFKNLTALDYSGVVPRVGLVIGIIQH